MDSQVNLQAADYVVTAMMLLVPLSIGIYFAIKDSKRATRDEYLLGGRRMTMLPVALSIFVTYMSAISLIGVPTDLYTYGPMLLIIYIAFTASYVVGYFTMVPLMYPLHLTSVYEYLQLRFQSQVVRMTFVSIGMLQTICYMAIALLAPGLCLQAAAGIPLWMSVVIVGIIGTVYTAIGGFKSVIWTDAFQAFLMNAGLIIIIVRGSIAVGGGTKVWDIAEEGGRTAPIHWTFDPRIRHSWLGSIIGGLFMWLVNGVNQSTLLRISAMKTLKDAKRSYLLNIPILLLYTGLLFGCAIAIYAYFATLRCDPYEAGLIANRNQLPPYFVMHSMSNLPGIPGLYMAAIFSGALSTISSGINALAANTVEDYLRKPLSKVKESTATFITKIIVCVYGALSIGLAYAVHSLKGPVTQMSSSISGACGGPILGVFALGASIPWANKYGALTGGVISIVVNIWMAVGSRTTERVIPTLTPPSTDNCFPNSTTAMSVSEFTTCTHFSNVSATSASQLTTTASSFDHESDFTFFPYDISYEWYGFTGAFLSFTIGLMVSYCTMGFVKSPTNPKLIFLILRKFWNLQEPKHIAADESNLVARENLKMSMEMIDTFKHKEYSFSIIDRAQEKPTQDRLLGGPEEAFIGKTGNYKHIQGVGKNGCTL